MEYIPCGKLSKLIDRLICELKIIVVINLFYYVSRIIGTVNVRNKGYVYLTDVGVVLQ